METVSEDRQLRRTRHLKGADVESVSELIYQKIPQMEGNRGNGQAHSEPRKTSKIQIKFSGYSH